MAIEEQGQRGKYGEIFAHFRGCKASLWLKEDKGDLAVMRSREEEMMPLTRTLGPYGLGIEEIKGEPDRHSHTAGWLVGSPPDGINF